MILVCLLIKHHNKKRALKNWGDAAPLPADGKLGLYQLGSLLANGGTATVYNGTDAQGQRVAIKIPHSGPLHDKKFVATFEREAQIGVDLRHPAIVRVLSAGSYLTDSKAKIPYFVMEYLEGQELDQLLQVGPLSANEAVGVARGVADALSWAHARGVIHRDISPRNIFVTLRRSIKVMDFGISTVVDRSSRSRKTRGLAFGTPEYMAPERTLDAALADERSDLYALGCVLYEMLVGTPPFVSETAEQTIAMQRKSPVPDLFKMGVASEELNLIVMKLLAKEPEKRFQSANEVIARLADFVPVQ